jgi:uncharacterized membrane protein (UPF0127 family)
LRERLTLLRNFFWGVFFGVASGFVCPVYAETLCVKKDCFTVEIARTDSERQRGLMYRSSMHKNSGMLFVFDREDIYPFWMKNTRLSLDIMWIGADNRIVFIEKRTTPYSETPIVPSRRAKWVLELLAGSVDRHQFKIGDSVRLE